MTTWLSEKVIRYFAQQQSEDSVLIDSNERMEEAVERYREKAARRKEENRRNLIAQYLDQVETAEDGTVTYPTDEEGNVIIPVDSDGNPLFALSEDNLPILPGDEAYDEEAGGEEEETPVLSPSEMVEEAHAEAERIIAEAQEQADQLLSDAEEKAQALKSNAVEEGRQEGYKAGQIEALNDYSEKEKALYDREEALKNEYLRKETEMESDLLNTILDVFSKFFSIEFSDKKEILLKLIENALSGIENSKEFLIHVSSSQLSDMNEKKAYLREKVGESASIDIIEDPTLREGGCLIETDGGVFDCSVETELESLVKDLKALSIG